MIKNNKKLEQVEKFHKSTTIDLTTFSGDQILALLTKLINSGNLKSKLVKNKIILEKRVDEVYKY